MKDLKHTYQPKKGFQNGLSDLLSGKVLEKGLFELLPFSLYICLLIVFYINNSYRAEDYVRTISSLERELKDLRSEYITTKSLLMFQSKQTEVQSLVANQGLHQSDYQPFIIHSN
jgi:hypothetical protein